jgi:hypothetical protein
MNPTTIGSGLGMSLGKFSDGTNPVSIRKCVIIEKCHQFPSRLPKSTITRKSHPLSEFLTTPQLGHSFLVMGNHVLGTIATVVIDYENFPTDRVSFYLSLEFLKNVWQSESAVVGGDGHCDIHR